MASAEPSLLEHFVVGAGEAPTLLLHGFLGSGRNLRSLAQGWSARDPGRRFLVLDLGTRSLELDVASDSAGSARALDGRIAGILKSGETPAVPPTLP